jgi:hypothetical protein
MNSQGKISVVLKNNNSTLSMNRFEVYDNVCDAPVGIITLKGGESRSIRIAQDLDGKGSVRIRNLDLGPSEWVEISFINPEDVITA